MIETPIRLLSMTSTRSTPAGQTVTVKANAPAPKTDVIDLSKPPTPEQAERLRSAGILGYGSVSVQKAVTSTKLSSNVSVTTVAGNYQHTFFDVVHEAAYTTSAAGLGVFWGDGSYACASVTTKTISSWKDGSQLESKLQLAAYSLHMSGTPDWYIPAHKNADGSLALAQFGPCTTATIRGYHSALTISQSGGGQTQVSRYETSVCQEAAIFPDQKRPVGAVDYRNEKFDRILTSGLLDGIDKCAQALRRFDMRA